MHSHELSHQDEAIGVFALMSSTEKDFDPSHYATLRLFKHLNVKGTQVGGVIGCGVVLPFLALRGYRAGKALDLNSTTRALAYSTAGGLILSSQPKPNSPFKAFPVDALGVAKYVGMDQEGLEDRVYRLHFNASQNRCDLFSLTCGVLATAFAPLLLNRSVITLAGNGINLATRGGARW